MSFYNGRTFGSLYLTMTTVVSTNAAWPGDGYGSFVAGTGSTGSLTAGDSEVVIDGVLVTAASTAQTTVTVLRHDGTTTAIAIPIAASQACPLYVPLGGEHGMKVPSGFSVKTSSTATLATVFFRRLSVPGA